MQNKFNDKFGNALIGMRDEEKILLELCLVGFKPKKIGTIWLHKRNFETSRIREKHLMRSVNGYGFNFELMSKTKLFDTILLNDEYSAWKIPRHIILEQGTYFNFKQKGFELQIFLSLEQLKPFIL